MVFCLHFLLPYWADWRDLFDNLARTLLFNDSTAFIYSCRILGCQPRLYAAVLYMDRF